MACSSSPVSPQKPVAPYGTWLSPLTAARVTAGALRFDQIQLDGDDVYWAEGRASEGGRNVIVRRTPDGVISDITPAGFNVRSRIHEYGGAAYTVDRGVVYFTNFADQRLYRQSIGGPPEAITSEGYYFADCQLDGRGRLICVREDHTVTGEPRATIVALGLSAGPGEPGGPARPGGAVGPGRPGGEVLVSGADFYSDPIVSPDGKTLAWLQWNHPNMPWDGTELWTAAITSDGSLGEREKIAGGVDESIFQPEWSPDGVLHFVSDRTGWWNLYRRRGSAIEPLRPMSAEFGKPQWTFSMVTYAFATATRIVATYSEGGRWMMALIESEERRFEPVSLSLEPIESVRANARVVYFIGASPTEPPAIVRMTIGAMETEVLRSSASERIAPEWISVPEAVTFRVSPSASARPVSSELRRDRAVAASGRVGGPAPPAPPCPPGPPGLSSPRDVHAFYYAPKNPTV
ncbi:MAG: hypothetical protein ACRD2A_00795, partial [Vicinamibacterales bacterium]